MDLPRFAKLFTPHDGSGRIAFAAGMLIMLGLGWLDYALGQDFRLHTLFAFPFAFIAIHCASAGAVFAAASVTFALEVFILFSYPLPLLTQAVSSLVALAFIALTAVLARVARKVHLAVSREATRDPLTGLRNRRSFDTLLETEIARQRRYGTRFSLLAIDLDRFKELNDGHGHGAGDQALRLVAQILHHRARDSDVVARLGGDEFAILMPNISLADCRMICADIVHGIAAGMSAAGFAITATVGSKTFYSAPRDRSSALEIVDKALYRAKAQGRNRAVSI